MIGAMSFQRLVALPPLRGSWQLLLNPQTPINTLHDHWALFLVPYPLEKLSCPKLSAQFGRHMDDVVEAFNARPFSKNHCFFLPIFHRYVSQYEESEDDLLGGQNSRTQSVMACYELILDHITDDEWTDRPDNIAASSFVSEHYGDEIEKIDDLVVMMVGAEEIEADGLGEGSDSLVDSLFNFPSGQRDRINARLKKRACIIIDLDETLWRFLGNDISHPPIARPYLKDFISGLSKLALSGLWVEIGIWSHADNQVEGHIPAELRQLCSFMIFRNDMRREGLWPVVKPYGTPFKDVSYPLRADRRPVCDSDQFYFFMDDRPDNQPQKRGYYQVERFDLRAGQMSDDRALLTALEVLDRALHGLGQDKTLDTAVLLSPGDTPWWARF